MMRIAGVFACAMLCTTVQAASLAGQHTEAARPGESESVVCRRASETVQGALLERLGSDMRQTAEFGLLHQAWVKRRLERAELDNAVQDELKAQLLFTETNRFWSGKRCFVQGLGEVDEERLWAALQAGLPPRPTPDAPEEQSEPDDGGWLVPPFFTNTQGFNTALTELSFLKMVVAEHYLSRGEWPETLADLRLSETDMATFEAVDLIALGADGEIIARLAGGLEGEEIRLRPRVTGHLIRWRCATTLDSWAARACQ